MIQHSKVSETSLCHLTFQCSLLEICSSQNKTVLHATL